MFGMGTGVASSLMVARRLFSTLLRCIKAREVQIFEHSGCSRKRIKFNLTEREIEFKPSTD